MEAETSTSPESNHCHNHKNIVGHREVISWIGIPKEIADDGCPLVDEKRVYAGTRNHGKRPLEEDEASSLTAWAQGYQEVGEEFA